MQLQLDSKTLSAYQTGMQSLISGLAPEYSNALTYQTIWDSFKVLDKQMNVVPFKPNRLQRDLMPKLTGRDLVLKMRKGGISTLIRAMHEATAMSERASLGTFAHDNDTTSNLRRMSERFWLSVPASIRPARSIDNASTTIYANTGSEVIIRTAGSRQGARSFTLSHVHGSEVAFWANPDETLTSIMEAMPIHGSIVLESTPNGAQGWFYEECMKALEGNSIWTLHFYEWWWSDDNRLTRDDLELLQKPELADDPITEDEQTLIDKHDLDRNQIWWRRYKILSDPQKFPQEHPEDVHRCFLSSGGSYFGNIEHVFTAPTNATYDNQHRYIGGLDFAQDKDYTVLVITDATTYEVVDRLRINKMLWADIRHRIQLMSEKWHSPLIYGEGNSMGKTNIELLQASGVRIRPFNTTAKSKPMLIQSLYAGLHEVRFRLMNDSNTKHEFRNFISKQTPSGNWQYEASNGSHDDEVIATALSWLGVMRINAMIEAI